MRSALSLALLSCLVAGGCTRFGFDPALADGGSLSEAALAGDRGAEPRRLDTGPWPADGRVDSAAGSEDAVRPADLPLKPRDAPGVDLPPGCLTDWDLWTCGGGQYCVATCGKYTISCSVAGYCTCSNGTSTNPCPSQPGSWCAKCYNHLMAGCCVGL